MKLFDQCLKFFFRIICRTVRSLRCKIITRHIAPEIHTAFRAFLRNHSHSNRITDCTALHKFISRHQFNRINPQFLPIRNHFFQCLECPFRTFDTPIYLCIASYMKFVENHLMIWNQRISVIFPVKGFIFQKSTSYFVRIIVCCRTKTFSSQNSVCTGICIYPSIYYEIVLIIL